MYYDNRFDKAIDHVIVRFIDVAEEMFYTSNGGTTGQKEYIGDRSFFEHYNLVGENKISLGRQASFVILLFANTSGANPYDLTWKIYCKAIAVQ